MSSKRAGGRVPLVRWSLIREGWILHRAQILGALAVSAILSLVLQNLDPPPRNEVVEIPDRFVDLILSEPEPVEEIRSLDQLVQESGIFGALSDGGGLRAAFGFFGVDVDVGDLSLYDHRRPPPDPPEEDTLRDWFPETLLWQPLVETGPQGLAQVEVAVPDSLTTWRVLALAHDARGQQDGAVHLFRSSLSACVDPAVPGWLYTGDHLDLHVIAVGTVALPTVSTSGALSGGGRGERVTLEATGAGPGRVEARLEDIDAVVRTLQITPTGRPVRLARGGVLTDQASLALQAPTGADPVTERLRVTLFPDASALLDAELARVAADPDAGAYGHGVVAARRALPGADAESLRRVSLLSRQRLVRTARTLDPSTSADLLVALGEEAPEPLHTRLVRTAVRGQRPDGTWFRPGTTTLQQTLVHTAWVARCLPEEEAGARLRASAVLERYALQIDDPYTASVVLGSGLAPEALEEELSALVGEPLPPGVKNPWGEPPSEDEVAAWAWLALGEGEQVAEMLPAFASRPRVRPVDGLVLEVLTRALPGVDEALSVHLGSTSATVVALGGPVVLEVPAGPVVLSADPPAPGLAFVAERLSWVPWTGEEAPEGVEVEAATTPLRAGRPGTLTVTAVAPQGHPLRLVQGLPSGVWVDEATLDSPWIEAWTVHPDRVELRLRPLQAGEVAEVELGVVPTWAGSFSTAPLQADGVAMAPMRWVIGP